jgi:hypothetical protein
MTDVIANLFVDIHQYKAKLSLFLDGNWVFIAPSVSEYSLWQRLLQVLPDGRTSLQCNTLLDHCSSKIDIAFKEI